MCVKAREQENYDHRVDDAYAHIKSVVDAEKAKKKEVVEKAKPISTFYAVAGHGLTEIPGSIIGIWRHEKTVLTFNKVGDKLVGKGSYTIKTTRPTFGLFGTSKQDVEQEWTIEYNLSQNGNFFSGTVSDRPTNNDLSSLLSGSSNHDLNAVLVDGGEKLLILVNEYGTPKPHTLSVVKALE